ncbi:ROK family glucokinase [soil metagenome]
MENFLGIDIGGTNLKMAIVNSEGSISDLNKVATETLRSQGSFVQNLLPVISSKLDKYPDINKIGIGFPGTLSKDRHTTLELPAIPQLNGVNVMQALKAKFPGKTFHLENDANAAALGEYFFPKDGKKLPDNFIFVTMGTGIGGAAIIDGKIFKGGDGNGMEIGHIFSRNSKLLEKNIGKQGIINMARVFLQDHTGDKKAYDNAELSSGDLVLAAVNGDNIALKVFETVGQILGEALVSIIRVLDIKTIIIGGGLSASFDFIIKSLKEVLNEHLTPYYTKEIFIKRATLANQAGIIGAASLCFQKEN